jgi:1,4-dihydroxy-2-naphthoate octaprenyltransferase
MLERACRDRAQGKIELKKWLMVIRAPFLPLSVVLAFLGACVAWWYDDAFHLGTFHLGYVFLAGFGILLAHISVDVLNEYFDYKSGVDLETIKTPFSGGSGALPSGLITPKQAWWLGVGSFIVLIPIGVYFVIVKGWLLLPLLVVAALCIVLYTPFILKLRWPEWAPGLGMGALPVIGAYFAQTGEYNWPLVIAAVPSFILVHNLLLLNEFPDVEADEKAGRKTTPITMGKPNASIVYSVLTVVVYLWIIGSVVTGIMPVFASIALLTIPFALKAIKNALESKDTSKLVPAMTNNVIVVLLTQFLLGIGYILAGVF